MTMSSGSVVANQDCTAVISHTAFGHIEITSSGELEG